MSVQCFCCFIRSRIKAKSSSISAVCPRNFWDIVRLRWWNFTHDGIISRSSGRREPRYLRCTWHLVRGAQIDSDAGREGNRKVGLISGNLWSIIRRPSGTRTAIKVDECTPPRGTKREEDERDARRTNRNTRVCVCVLACRVTHIAVACRSYPIESWIALRWDVTWLLRIEEQKTRWLRALALIHTGTRVTASVSEAIDGT